MTEGLLTSSRTKSKLLKLKLNHPTEANLQKYRNFINQYNKLKKKLKTKYFHDKIENNKFNIKNTWNILKSIIGKENDKSNLPQSFTINNIR